MLLALQIITSELNCSEQQQGATTNSKCQQLTAMDGLDGSLNDSFFSLHGTHHLGAMSGMSRLGHDGHDILRSWDRR